MNDKNNEAVEQTNPVLISASDHDLLQSLLLQMERNEDLIRLKEQLDKAIVVKKEAFPPNTVGIGSRVTIAATTGQMQKKLILVLPGQADLRQQRISVLSPMGIALLGVREQETVSCRLPSGTREFRLLEVRNDFS